MKYTSAVRDREATAIGERFSFDFEGLPRIGCVWFHSTRLFIYPHQNPDEPKLGTFFTPFPNGRFFGAIQTNGPLNIQGFRPSVTIQLPRRASLTADAYFFWRQSINDALYVSGFPLRFGLGGSRFVGAQPGAVLFWPITKHVSIDANYAYFAAGEFLHENPPDKNLSYVGLIFSYRF